MRTLHQKHGKLSNHLMSQIRMGIQKIKDDNNAPEKIAIKKNSVVNSESEKYKYIYISQ